MAISVGTSAQGSASSTTVTVPYTCTTGTDRKLLVGAGGEYNGAIDVSSATYNGQSLTKVIEEDVGTGYTANSAIFYLDDEDFPGTPGQYDLVVTFSQATWNMVHVVQIDGAAQGDPEAQNSSENGSSPSSLSTTITTQTADALIFGFIQVGNAGVAFSPTSGQTELEETQGGGSDSSAASGEEIIASAGAGYRTGTGGLRDRYHALDCTVL